MSVSLDAVREPADVRRLPAAELPELARLVRG